MGVEENDRQSLPFLASFDCGKTLESPLYHLSLSHLHKLSRRKTA